MSSWQLAWSCQTCSHATRAVLQEQQDGKTQTWQANRLVVLKGRKGYIKDRHLQQGICQRPTLSEVEASLYIMNWRPHKIRKTIQNGQSCAVCCAFVLRGWGRKLKMRPLVATNSETTESGEVEHSTWSILCLKSGYKSDCSESDTRRKGGQTKASCHTQQATDSAKQTLNSIDC